MSRRRALDESFQPNTRRSPAPAPPQVSREPPLPRKQPSHAPQDLPKNRKLKEKGAKE